jgi:type I restriction enzyme S subunit
MENNIKQGWVECSLGDILTAKKGKKPTSVINDPKEGYVPYILIDEMEGKPIRTYTNDPKVSIIDESEVLLVWDGSIGKCGSGMKGAIGSTLVGLKALDEIQTKFLEYTIKLQNNFIKETSTGSGLQHINKDFFEICKIPLPPLAEQNRIVAKLDAVLQKIDSNKQRLGRIPKLLKRFRQSVLESAVSGKLTEEWREKNKDAKNIFDVIDIIVEQRKLDYENLIIEMSLLGKSKPRKPENLIPTVSVSDDFPKSWGIMTFLDISSTKQYSMSSGPFGSSLGTKDYRATGVPVVRGQNIQGGVFIAKNFVFISEEKAIELKRSSAIPNDIVIVAVGVGVGNAAIIPNEIERIILSQNCNKFTLDFKIVAPKFILYNLQVSGIKEQMDEATTDTAREFLSLTNLKKLHFPIPPIEEQKEIIRRVEQLFAFADKIETRYTKAKAMLDKLPQSILAKAFRGELVAQDPNDEPASVLLERIKLEKEKLAAEKKGKKTKEYSIEETPVKIAADKKVKYKKTKNAKT